MCVTMDLVRVSSMKKGHTMTFPAMPERSGETVTSWWYPCVPGQGRYTLHRPLILRKNGKNTSSRSKFLVMTDREDLL